MHAWQLATIGSLLVMGLALGCASRADRYTPEPALARGSLEKALTALCDGQPIDSLAGSPSIQLVDTSRQPGQVLRSFEILSEQSTGAQGRLFIVRLKFEQPTAEMRVRYVVVGIDPIWIFHKDDYDRLAHWEHPMEVNEPAEPEGKKAEPKTPPVEPAAPVSSAQRSPGNDVRS